MRNIPRWLVLTLLVSAAIASYFVGLVKGAGLFLFLGCLFELSFWVKILRPSSKQKKLSDKLNEPKQLKEAHNKR